MTTYLLDVNLLLALSDPMHVHHEPAHHWFESVGHISWATCPITENGYVRIAGHPSYPNRPGDAQVVLDLLRRFCLHEGHNFWPDAVSLRNVVRSNVAVTHGQITDLYLIALALHHGGKLATLDQRLTTTAIVGGEGVLEQIQT